MDTTPLLSGRKDTAAPRSSRLCFVSESEFACLHPTLRRFECSNGHCVYNGYATSQHAEPDRSGNKQSVVGVLFSHGFGANALSFEALMAYLEAHRAEFGSLSMATHDAYGFGYSTSLGTDHEKDDGFLDAISLYKNGRDAGVSVVKEVIQPKLGEDPLVFVGHSMGSITAMSAACAMREEGYAVRAVVLVAPAILAGQTTKNPASMSHFHHATSFVIRVIFHLIYGLCFLPCRALSRAILKMSFSTLVSIPCFWSSALHVVFYFKTGYPSAKTTCQYSIAAKKEGWTDHLADFVEAHIWNVSRSPPQESMHEQFSSLLASGVKILIVHSEDDLLVPVGNSQKLYEQFRECRGGEGLIYESVRGKGHMPHEADLEEFGTLLQKHGIFFP